MYGGIIHKKCKGCRKIEEHFGRLWCSVYAFPARWWEYGGRECPFNAKVKIESTKKIRVGQQKQVKGGKK